MSQTPCNRSSFPLPMRWLHAGGGLSSARLARSSAPNTS
jgi:hypothetical protein